MERPFVKAALRRPVGLLALQGDFRMHAEALARLGVASRELRTLADLEGARATCAGLVLPGGESTAMLNLIERERLGPALAELLRGAREDGWPVLATCAGLILAAARVARPAQASLGALDVDVERNAYGRQVASGVFELAGEHGFPACTGTFIRAPRIVRAGPGVQVLARRGGDPVLVRQGNVLGASFHPEMDAQHPASELFVRALAESEAAASAR